MERLDLGHKIDNSALASVVNYLDGVFSWEVALVSRFFCLDG